MKNEMKIEETRHLVGRKRWWFGRWVVVQNPSFTLCGVKPASVRRVRTSASSDRTRG